MPKLCLHSLFVTRFLGAAALLFSAFSIPAFAGKLSPMTKAPDWSELDVYQETMTKGYFRLLVDQVYAPNKAFWRYAKLGANSVTVYSDKEKTKKLWTLRFAKNKASQKPRPLVFAPERKSEPVQGKPLAGMKIVLDPGHMGGKWAVQEERYFKIGDDNPIKEGEMALITCQYIKTKLEALGAEVHLTRTKNEPITKERAENLRDEAVEALEIWRERPVKNLNSPKTQALITKVAAGLFNRQAEIGARAKLIEKWKPDLTICLHYNASDWGEPGRARMAPKSRLVTFVQGCYSVGELKYDDQKWHMLRNVLDNTYPFEVAAADLISQQTAKTFRMEPETYKGWKAVQRVGPNPYVFARNLLANRIYRGPVLFVEGPYMNAKDAYDWMEAGDYNGLRTFNGREVPSIMRAFADAVVKGVVQYADGKSYRQNRDRLEAKS